MVLTRYAGRFWTFSFGLCVLVALATSCARQALEGDSTGPGPTSEEQDQDALYPFTAKQISDATKPGRRYMFKMESKGSAPMYVETEFVRCDEEGCVANRTNYDEDRRQQGPANRQEATWVELRSHSRFLKAATTAGEAEVHVPAGSYDCISYTVREGNGTVQHYYYARNLPGPPVLAEVEMHGEIVWSMRLVEYDAGRSDSE